jgi:RHS repeat-associated protein
VDGNGTQYVGNATYYASGGEYQLFMPGIYFRTDLNPRLQVSRYYSDNGQVNSFFIDKTYNYGPLHQNNGNVASIINNKDSSRTQTFTYDALNRITSGWSSANTGSYSWGENYSIDAWGNLQISPMSGKAHGGNFTLSGNAQNRPTGLNYDAAGNLLSYLTANYTYDQENRLLSTAGMTYTYDGNGERVLKSQVINNVLTPVKRYWSMGGNTLAEGDASGNLTAEYIYFGGKRIARVDLGTNTVHYYLTDHLGSTSIVASAAGAVEEESDYYPFGTEVVVTGPGTNELKFTGKRRDTESQLDYFGARYFDNPFGRFMTPDPLIVQKQKLLDPQQWNMYQYARGNPLRFTDPTGKYVCEGNKTQCGVIKTALALAKTAAGKLPEGSKERKELEKSIAAYGKENTKNGVVVQFKDLNDLGFRAGTTIDEKTKVTTVVFDLNAIGKTGTAGEIVASTGHEGVHVADYKAAGHMPRSRNEELATERNAFNASAGVAIGLGFRSAQGLWDPGWSSGHTPAEMNQMKDKSIEDSAQRATDLYCAQMAGLCK